MKNLKKFGFKCHNTENKGGGVFSLTDVSTTQPLHPGLRGKPRTREQKDFKPLDQDACG